jgi:hypothetical protein
MKLRSLPLVVALMVSAGPALGQYPRDDAANKKIREALESHYLSTEFDKAEQLLVGTIDACENKCSPATLSKAWMYVGIVRGSGKNNLPGAKDAFSKAVAIDPAVKLDTQLATPQTQQVFQEAGGTAAGPAEATAPKQGQEGEPEPEEKAAPAAEGTGLDCSPKVVEVETRRAIPVQCRTETAATSVELRYKPAGEEWQSLPMVKKGDSFRAEIPCDRTHVSGALRLFVRAKDASGDEVAGWGTKAAPIQIGLVEKTGAEAPSFDDADPPARCEAKEDCPPNFPGCAAGTAAQSCESDDECDQGSCVEGKCDKTAGSTGPYAKNWLGLHIAQDFAFVGGDDVCTQASQNDDSYACYYSGSDTGAYVDDPYPGTKTSTGLVPATTRIMLSYDRAFSPRVMIGLRAGYAFGGGPPSGRDVVYDANGRIVRVVEEGLDFLPFHLEARLSYWFGQDALSKKGIRPYVHVGGGLAQIDAKAEVPVQDCGLFAPQGTPDYQACASGSVASNDPRLQTVELDAWKKLGQGFATIGGGAVYAFTEKLGLQLNVNLMYTLPASGIVIEPSLGATMGF